MSKLQNPFKTLTEQNLSRKTLPWLWSGISLGVGGPADPWNILKRDSWFTQCTILANRPRSDIQYTCRAQALRLAKNAKFLGFFYHTPRSVTGTCTDITEVFILGEREGEYQNYSCRLNEDHANVCEEVGSERIRSLTHISSQEENTPQTILHGWVTNLRLTLSPIWWGVGGVHTPSALHQIGLRARINIHALYHFYLGTIIPHVTWFFSWREAVVNLSEVLIHAYHQTLTFFTFTLQWKLTWINHLEASGIYRASLLRGMSRSTSRKTAL